MNTTCFPRLGAWFLALAIAIVTALGSAPAAGEVIFSASGYIDDGLDTGCAQTCAPCEGMPRWWVSEPYTSLWLADEPLAYHTSTGERMAFRLTYKQRDTRPWPVLYPPGGRTVPPTTWNHNWFSYIYVTPYSNWWASLDNFRAVVYLPGGGEARFAYSSFGSGFDGTLDPASGMQLIPLPGKGSSPVGNTWPPPTQKLVADGTIGFLLIHPDGTQDIYGCLSQLRKSSSSSIIYWAEFTLSDHIDPRGHRTRFQYETPSTGYGAVTVLRRVIDCDNRTNLLSYITTATNALLSQVQSPDGRTALMDYDEHGWLTNITDAAHMSSEIRYNAYGVVTNLVTPYGATHFRHSPDDESASSNAIHAITRRFIEVVAPLHSTNLHLFSFYTPQLAASAPDSRVPAGTPYGTLDTGTTDTNSSASLQQRNSFHWNPRQAQGLPAAFTNYTSADYARARMNHWLDDGSGSNVVQVLSVGRAASPDGSVEGTWLFLDYPDKTNAWAASTQTRSQVVAQRLPNGDTQYTWTRCNSVGFVTNAVATYTAPDGAVGTRTNKYTFQPRNTTITLPPFYTNAFDLTNLLTAVTGADGRQLAGLGEYEPVTVTNAYETVYGDTNFLLSTAPRSLPSKVTNAQGEVAQYTFDSVNRLLRQKSPAGLTLTNRYDAAGFLTNVALVEIGATNAFAYTNGQVRSFKNSRGLTLTLEWDALLRRTRTVFPDATFVSNRYDRLDLVSTVDRLSNWTWLGHDALQHPTRLTNALNQVTSWDWCGCDVLDSMTDALTNTTLLYYDNQGRLSNALYADQRQAFYDYDFAGRLWRVRDGTGRWQTFAYNNQGLLTAVSNALGRVLAVEYDILDLPVRGTDGLGLTTTNTFDTVGRLTRRAWPGGSEAWGYTSNVTAATSYTNALDTVTRYAYDVAGRLTNIVWQDTNGKALATNAFAYEPDGTLKTLTDGNGHVTTWNRDLYGRITQKLAHGGTVAFTNGYDANNNLTEHWTPGKGANRYTYDAVGNLRTLTNTAQGFGRVLTYDALRRLTDATAITGTNTLTVGFGYTATGQLQREDGPWPDDTVSYGYTSGHRTALALSSEPATLDVAYGYDPAWRLQTLTSPAGTFGYDYSDPNGRLLTLPTRLGLPNGAAISNHFDIRGRIDYTGLLSPGSAAFVHVLDGFNYAHDPLGLRTNTLRDFGLTNNGVAINYDPLGQITGWKAQDPGNILRLNEQLGYAYDAAGNVLRRTNNALVQTFAVDALNQLATVSRTGLLTVSGSTPAPASSVTVNNDDAVRYSDFTWASSNGFALSNGLNTFRVVATSAANLGSATNVLSANLPATNSFLYDANGNLTHDGWRSFEYDAADQLTAVAVTNSWRIEFAYDALGRKRLERESKWQAGNWSQTNETRYVYDGGLVIQQRDTSNNPLGTYTHGLDLSGTLEGAGGIGGLLARTDANGSLYYHSDGAGNVTALLDAKSDVVARYLYDPYGNLLGKWGPLAEGNRYRFSSKEWQTNPGLYYYGYRFYAPNLQRWLNQDPLGEAGGVNLWTFVANEPVNVIDPHGLMEFQWYNPISWYWPGYGGPAYSPPLHMPLPSYSNAALLAQEGLGINNDFGGKTAAEVASDVGMAVPKGLAMAAMMLPLGGEEGAYAAADEALQAARAARAGSKCFRSFEALKRAYPNSPGNVWHHIVEQSQIPRFGAEAIQNMGNVVELSPTVNQSLNALYSSINPVITGSASQTVRQWLKTQSFDQARAFGLRAIQNVKNGVWP